MAFDLNHRLRQAGIRPTAQRELIAEQVLGRLNHPSADEVFKAVKAKSEYVSQATVYNTLNALVQVGLLQQVDLGFGRVIYDCNTEQHHHFIDEVSGQIIDIPLDDVTLSPRYESDYTITSVQLVIRGKPRQLSHLK